MRTYNSKALRIEFAAPWVKCLIIAIAFFIVSVLIYLLPPNNLPIDGVLLKCNRVILSISISLFLISVLLRIFFTQAKQIKHMIMIGLYYRRYGNPLCLRDGEFLPIIKVKQLSNTKFLLTIYAIVVNAEILQKLGVTVSSILNRRYQRFAVTVLNTDVALSYVQYTLEDVTIDKSFSFYSVDQMKPVRQTVFVVQKGDSIDLTTSGSILVAGKTRSGKTTGIIAILIQALLCGRDHQYSQITIIDPKCAELSVLPHVVTVDDDVEATAILQSLKEFEAAMRKRQRILNERSKQIGDAVHWWEFDMHPSFLFIDEYVACRSLFPKKAEKGSDYCLAAFDNTLKRIVTMGASAGCFVILSIAEASVDEGGLPTMLKNAMTTKILFKPTLTEGRLIWDSSKLENFPERVYSAGDCWFSSTDGEHDDVAFCHFPHMRFPVYRELGRLLKEYYGESADGGVPQDGARRENTISY